MSKTKVIKIMYYINGRIEKMVRFANGKLVVYPGGGR